MFQIWACPVPWVLGRGNAHTHTHTCECVRTYARAYVRTYVRTYSKLTRSNIVVRGINVNHPCVAGTPHCAPNVGAQCRRLLRRASNFKLTRRIAKTPQPSVQWPQRPQSLRIAYNGRISTAICQSVQGACDCDMREITKTGLYHSLA